MHNFYPRFVIPKHIMKWPQEIIEGSPEWIHSRTNRVNSLIYILMLLRNIEYIYIVWWWICVNSVEEKIQIHEYENVNGYIFFYSMYTTKIVNVYADKVKRFSYLIRKGKGRRRFSIDRWSEWNKKNERSISVQPTKLTRSIEYHTFR